MGKRSPPTHLVLCFLSLFLIANCASNPKVEVPEPVPEEEPITFELKPIVTFTSTDTRVYKYIVIRIKEHPDNNAIVLEWNSEDGEAGRSERPLNGIYSPHIIEASFFFGNSGFTLTHGHYVVQVTLFRNNGEYFSKRIETSVVSAEFSE